MTTTQKGGASRPCLNVAITVVSANNAGTSPAGGKKVKNGALQRFLYSQGYGKPHRYWPLRAWQRSEAV